MLKIYFFSQSISHSGVILELLYSVDEQSGEITKLVNSGDYRYSSILLKIYFLSVHIAHSGEILELLYSVDEQSGEITKLVNSGDYRYNQLVVLL